MVYNPPNTPEEPQNTPLNDFTTYAGRPPTFLPPPIPLSPDRVNMSEPAAEEVWRLLTTLLANKSAYKALLGLKDDKAQAMLDILHKVLDSQDVPAKLGHAALYATMRLCAASGAYPRCLALQEIRYETKPVASGAFGDIWKGYHRNHPVSLKVARVYQGSDVEHLIKTYMREAIMWSHLSHPNVLPFYGIYQVDERLGCVCLVSPWMQNGNVNEYLKAQPEAPRLPLVHDIIAGLRYLHNQSVVHGDLKGANILISGVGSACLADFGLSSLIDSEILRWTSLKTMTRVGGTVRWQAPELMDDPDDGSRPTLPADIYSVASVMYEVFTDQLPFHEIRNDTTVMLRVMKGIRPTRPSPDQALELSAEIWDVMERCWSHTPGERPSVDQVSEKLARINPTESTLKRMYVQKFERKEDAELDAPTALSFRAAMRGQSANFSGAEVDLLRKYAGGSSQVTLGANSPLPPFDGHDAIIHSTGLYAPTMQMTAGPDMGTRAFPSEAAVSTDNSNTLDRSRAALEVSIQSPTPYLPPEPWSQPVLFHASMTPYATGPNVTSAQPIRSLRPPSPPRYNSQPFFDPLGYGPRPSHLYDYPNPVIHNGQRPVPVIHPLLDGENPRFNLLFDLSSPMFGPVKRTAFGHSAPLGIGELRAPFSALALKNINIVCDLIPQWPLRIGLDWNFKATQSPWSEYPAELEPGLISVGVILRALHHHFRERVTDMDWAQLSPEEEIKVARAYTARCKALGPGAVEEKSRGVRRVDCVKGRVWFRGLTRAGDSFDAFKLHLDRNSGHSGS